MLAGAGGTAPYTFELCSGQLPAGLILGAGGTLSGTPTAPERDCFTVCVTDAAGCRGLVDYSIVIQPPYCPAGPPIAISPSALPSARPNAPYIELVTATGGTPPYTFAVTSGALPPGLSLTPAADGLSAYVSGVPTVQGDFPLTITVTDANGCFNTMACSMVLSVVIPATSGTTLLLLSMALAVVGCVAMRRMS
jgi:hypothetical protein